MWTCKEMKKKGWDHLEGTIWPAVLLTLVFFILTGTMQFIQQFISIIRLYAETMQLNQLGDTLNANGTAASAAGSLNSSFQSLGLSLVSLLISFLVIIALFFVTNPLLVGYSRWFLTNRTSDGRPSIKILFSMFKSGSFMGAVAGMGWMTLWAMIWSYVGSLCLMPFYVGIIFFIIFVISKSITVMNPTANGEVTDPQVLLHEIVHQMQLIPDYVYVIFALFFVIGTAGYYAIVLNRKYAYMFTSFILSENPAYGAKKALALSIRMTKGMRGKLFLLDLSFIGWWMLSLLTLNLLSLGVTPYQYSAYAEVYSWRKNDQNIVIE